MGSTASSDGLDTPSVRSNRWACCWALLPRSGLVQRPNSDAACKPPRPGSRGASYSGQPATGVQLQVTAGTTTAGVFGVMATNPMSLIGEFGPEKTTLTAPETDPVEPS